MKYKLKRVYRKSYAKEKALLIIMAVLIMGVCFTAGYYAGQYYAI